MGTQKRSKTTVTWKQIVIFVIAEFIIVFVVLSILQFLGLLSYGPFVTGIVAAIVAGGAAIAVNLLINRHRLMRNTT
jgi:uncharacterized membrane-anchored protein